MKNPTHFFGEKRATSLAVAVLLLIHYALALAGAWNKSAAFDETAHITAGFSYWSFDDYRLQPENGNLPQRLAALPLVLSGGFAFPDRDLEAWRISDVWSVGDWFFHKVGNTPLAILRRSRACMALLGAALCLTVFLWARSLHGTAGGFIALVLCAFSPLVLAHGPLATSDICATLFFVLSIRSLWAILHRVTLARFLGCAASLSCLALSKTSAVLVLPMLALMVPFVLLRDREWALSLPGGKQLTILPARRRILGMAGVLLLCALVAWGAIWVAFGCRFAPVPPQERPRFSRYFFAGAPISTLADVAENAGAPGVAIDVIGRLRLFPEAFLYGTGFVLAAAHHYGFLNGEVFTEGRLSFFPYCLLVKSTLPLLLLLLTAAGASVAARAGYARPAAAPVPTPPELSTAPLWIMLAVLVPSLLLSTINIGARHLLPACPALFILIGGLARWRPIPWMRWLIALLLCWHVVEAGRGFPHYLAYFNQVTGRGHAYRHLVDSSLDWGQDLPGLKTYLDRRRQVEPKVRAYLSYFGTDSPASYGIVAEPMELPERSRLNLPPVGEAGIYCVSATNLQAVYLSVRGRWNSRYEEEYRELLRAPGGAGSLPRFLQLGNARLLAFLRTREPSADIGFSILCYDLGEDDLRQAFEGPSPEPTPLGHPGS